MMKKTWLFIGLVVAALEMVAAPWHYPQYLDHNIPHRQRENLCSCRSTQFFPFSSAENTSRVGQKAHRCRRVIRPVNG